MNIQDRGAFVTEAFAYLRTAGGGRSASTRRSYQTGLAHFQRYLESIHGWQTGTPIAALSPENVWGYPAWLRQQTYRRARHTAPIHLAEKTRGLYLISVTRFIRFLILRRRLPLFDFAEYELLKEELLSAVSIREEPIGRKIPSESIIRAIVEAAQRPRAFNRQTAPAGRHRLTLEWYRNLAITLALKSSGMRVGELVSLKRGDLDEGRRGAWVMGKGRRVRFVAFDNETWRAINEYLERRRDEGVISKYPLFCRHDRHVNKVDRWPLTPRAIAYIIDKLGRNAGINFNLHPHSFRHYFANKLLAYTGNLALVQDALGHTDPKTTRIYTAIKPEEIARSVQAMALDAPGIVERPAQTSPLNTLLESEL